MGDYDSSDADQYYNDVWVDRRDELLAGNIGLDQTSKTPIAEEIISEKEIEDYYKSQDEDQDEDDEELLAFYASQESEATEYSRAKAKRAAQHFGMDLQTVIDAGNVEEMIYDYEQDVDWAEREASFYGEAKATEFTYPILNDHFTYKSLSQDYLTCNHCGIDILSTYYEELGNAVWGVEGEKKAVQHLKEEHGITEALEKKGWECPLCHVILGDGDVEPYDHVKIHSAAMEYDPDDPEQMIDYRSDKSESDEYDPDPSDPDFLGYINEEITPDFYHKVKSQHSQYTYDGFRDAEDELDKERGDLDYDALEHDVDIQDGVAEEDLAENNGLNTSSNQAGNVFACPDCGFKTHNRDEYDAHNDTHGNIPATVETPLSEENIAVANNDYQLLSRFS